MRFDKILDDVKISGALHSSEIRSFKCYSFLTVSSKTNSNKTDFISMLKINLEFFFKKKDSFEL